MRTRITTPAGPVRMAAGPGVGRYELRWCSRPPGDRWPEQDGQGFLYEGPHGPAYVDADRGRMRVGGPISIDCGPPLAGIRDALEHSGLALTIDGTALVMRCEEAMSWRRGRAMRVLAGGRELARFVWRRRAVDMERPDGSVLTQVPSGPRGRGELAGDAQALEAGLLVVVHAAFLGGALAPLCSWRAWPAVGAASPACERRCSPWVP